MKPDGRVIIDTLIDTDGMKYGIEGIKKRASRLSATIDKLGESVRASFQRQINSVNQAYSSYSRQIEIVDKLQEQIAELAGKDIPTDQYKNLENVFNRLSQEWFELDSKFTEWSSLGAPTDSLAMKELVKQMDEVEERQKGIRKRQAEMRKKGRAFVDPKSTREYRDLLAKLNMETEKAVQMDGRLRASYVSLSKKVDDYRKKNNKLIKVSRLLRKAVSFVGAALKSMGTALVKVGSTIKSVVSALRKAVNGMFSLNKQTKNTQMTMGEMLGMSLLFSGVFQAISAVTGGVGEGLNNLVQYSNVTNAAISQLLSSLTQLKNSFATAFSPVLTVVTPIMSAFIDMISRAVTYVGMFFAAMTGQSSFVKAVAVQRDYAAELNQTAGSAENAAGGLEDAADAADKAEKAAERYLSPLDDLNRYLDETGKNAESSEGGGVSFPTIGGSTLKPSDMFEEVPIANSIKGLAEKMKKLIKGQDWEGLGELIADGLNNGMQKVYDAISWKKVGPKLTAFADAFSRTFNSLVKNLDFDLIGRTIGAGVNTIVNTLNRLIGPGGIDFKQLGTKLSQGLRGMIGEIDWMNLGNLLGNYFMISWNILSGFVADMARKSDAGLTGWQELGVAIGEAINGIFERINFSEIGRTVAMGINGIFETIGSLAKTIKWGDIAKNLSDGLNTAFSTIKWAEAGKSLNAFLSGIVGFMVDVLRKTNWDTLGKGIGTFLSQIDWVGHLWSLVTAIASAIASAIGSLFDGLEAGGTAGKIAAFLGKAFIAVKILDITGVRTLVKKLVVLIATELLTAENISTVAGKIKDLFGGSTKQAGDLLGDLGNAASVSNGKFGTFAKTLGGFVGAAGLIVGVASAAAFATSKLSSFVEKLQGGNGDATPFGESLGELTRKLRENSDITPQAAEELFKLKEKLETTKMSTDEMQAATQQLFDKLAGYGVTREQAEMALAGIQSSTYLTDEQTKLLTQSIQTLGTESANMAANLNLSALSSSEALSGLGTAIQNMRNQLGLTSDEFNALDTVLMEAENGSITAQEAYQGIIDRLKDMGYNTETAAQIISEAIPGAVEAVKTSVDTNIVGAQQTISSSMETAEKDVKDSTDSMKDSAQKNLPEVEKSASEAFGNVESDSDEYWTNSAGSVTESLDTMNRDTRNVMGDVMTTIQDYWSSVLINTNQIWEKVSEKIANEMGKAFASVDSLSNRIANTMNDVIRRVNATISNINYSLSGVERAFSFSYDFFNPMSNTRYWGSYRLNLGRVPTVPYLATGAVIPPNSEFLAVLGDQKQGNNIEAPESLIRRIVREETGNNSGVQRIEVPVYLNRKQIARAIVDEAKLMRMQTGKNPFELA